MVFAFSVMKKCGSLVLSVAFFLSMCSIMYSGEKATLSAMLSRVAGQEVVYFLVFVAGCLVPFFSLVAGGIVLKHRHLGVVLTVCNVVGLEVAVLCMV